MKEGLQWPSDWARDGFIIFTDVPLDEDRDIWVVKADGSEAPFPYLDTPFIEKSADVSPDGLDCVPFQRARPVRGLVNSFPNPPRHR